MNNQQESKRKSDHIDLAFAAQTSISDSRFNYEPLLKEHPVNGSIPPVHFAGKVLQVPIWISSMTGGAAHAAEINKNLAIACRTFGMGMGLGSCRSLLNSNDNINDFSVRKHIGDQVLFANLGIAQVEQLLDQGKAKQIEELVKRLEADGLILHVNPLQEWLQPEGDIILHPPLETITRLLEVFKAPLIVKEVGQGFGPRSMRALAELPLEAIDFGALGGTNFSLLENMRSSDLRRETFQSVANVGHSAAEMTQMAIDLLEDPAFSVKARGFIVSGGVKDYMDGYHHISRIPYKAIYGQASAFLKYALIGEQELLEFTELQVKGLEMAYNYLSPKNQ